MGWGGECIYREDALGLYRCAATNMLLITSNNTQTGCIRMKYCL